MSNPNKHKTSSIPNGVDVLAVYGCRTVQATGPSDIQAGESPSEWIARIIKGDSDD